jgi:hypothetical protein
MRKKTKTSGKTKQLDVGTIFETNLKGIGKVLGIIKKVYIDNYLIEITTYPKDKEMTVTKILQNVTVVPQKAVTKSKN